MTLDPTGLHDSHDALQALVDGDYPAIIPPGYYYISRPVVVTKPKVITMSQPLLQPFAVDPLFRDSRKPGPNIMQSHTRLWTDQNINFFEIRSPQVFIDGGCFDAQNVVGWNKAALYYPGCCKDHNNRMNGWGGGAKNFLVIGNYLDMIINKNDGGYGVYFDFENYPEPYSYWTHMQFAYKVYGMRCGWYSSPFSVPLQFANTVDIEIETNYSKQSVCNHSFDMLRIKSRHQGAYVFPSTEEAESTASIFSRHRIFLEDNTFYDFRTAQDIPAAGGCWMNSRTLELYGESVLDERFPTMRSRAIYIAKTRPRTSLDGATGFIPRQSGQPLFIPDLHDILYAHFKTALITTKTYKGRQDLDTLASESDGETSTDCTTTYPENLFRWNKTLTIYNWNQTAIDRGDYVELVINCAPITVRNLWISLQDNRCPVELQIITLDQYGTVIDNTVRKLLPLDTVSNSREEAFSLVWDKGQIIKFIFRFIGCSSAGPIVVEGIFGVDSRHKLPNPLVCR